MDPPTLPLSSAPESCISTLPPPTTTVPSQLLEISLISAQDLAPIYKSMQTYAVAWINAAGRKHTTQTDHKGNKNPTWDEKFTFPIDSQSEDAILTVEIYTVSWIRDVLVGMVKAPVADLINPLARTRQNRAGYTRFVALQVLRSSGDPQGILNMGIALVESTMRSTAAAQSMHKAKSEIRLDDDVDDNKKELNEKINLWRSMSTGSSSQVTNNEEFPVKLGSVCNGSEICSDIGPSASIVAMEIAKKHFPEHPNPRQADHHQGDTGSSILEDLTIEDARAKGYGQVASRWRKVAAQYDHRGDDHGDDSELLWDAKGRRRHPRRSSDGSLLSCLVFGMEFTIVCGGSKNGRGNKSSYSSSSRRRIMNNTESNSG